MTQAAAGPAVAASPVGEADSPAEAAEAAEAAFGNRFLDRAALAGTPADVLE